MWRISRLIRDEYWDNLVRRVDAAHLEQVLPDPKLPSYEWRNLYVPAHDDQAFQYFTDVSRESPKLHLAVHRSAGEG